MYILVIAKIVRMAEAMSIYLKKLLNIAVVYHACLSRCNFLLSFFMSSFLTSKKCFSTAKKSRQPMIYKISSIVLLCRTMFN